MAKEDVRVTKTKRDLRNALYQLIIKEKFEKITVGEICDAAMVNRITFYKHYADKYELLNDILLDIKGSVVAKALSGCDLSNPNIMTASDFMLNLIDIVTDECLDRKDFLLAMNNNDMVALMISDVIEKSIIELLKSIGKMVEYRYSVEMLAAGITGAATYLIKYWLFHGGDRKKEDFLMGAKAFVFDLFTSRLIISQ